MSRNAEAIKAIMGVLTLICVILLAPPDHARAALNPNSLPTLRVLYARLFQMVTNNEFETQIAFYQKYAELDWTGTDANGSERNRSDELSALEDDAAGRALANVPDGAYFVLDGIIDYGGKAIVKSELREPTLFLSNAGPHPSETTIVRYRDIWEPTRNGWRWVSREESAPESARPM